MMKRRFGIVAVVMLVGAWLAVAEAAGPLTLEASIGLGSRAHDLVLDLDRPDGPLAYVATDLGLSVVDISSPTVPVLRGAVSLGGKSYGITRQGSLVFVANQTTGLRVVDVANPNAPVVVGTQRIPYKAWDVAVKDDVVYVVSFGGEMYVYRYARPQPPAVVLTRIKVIGLLPWSRPSQDAAQLTKMNNYVTSGAAKVTGVSVVGNTLLTQDFAHGRLFYYDVSEAGNPRFAGTHYAPFLLRVDSDPAEEVAYALSAYGGTSGIYSVPLVLLDPWKSTYQATCSACGYYKSPTTDHGGLTVSSNGNYVVYLAGKQGIIEVVDVSDPVVMTSGGWLPLTGHASKLAESMGAATSGDYIFAAAGALGFRVYRYPGLSD